MIRIDMSEYMEPHSISRLIGAPPGYVGFEEGGQLTEVVRKKPYSVILFDEIEKAHPRVLNVLLQVLDDGRLTDGQGRTVNFQNSIIIMTSNIGSLKILETPVVERNNETFKNMIMQELLTHMRPELLNRMDEMVIFNSLSEDMVEKIIQIQVKRLDERLFKQQGIHLVITKDVIAEVAKQGWDVQFGARPLKRALQEMVEVPLSMELLSGKFSQGNTVTVEKNPDGTICFRSQ